MSANHPNHPPLTGATLALGSFSVGLAGFMTVLDSSIANVAIPTISGNLGVSVDEGTWIITVFAAANSVSIPLTGWLTERDETPPNIWSIQGFAPSRPNTGHEKRCRESRRTI